MSRASRAKRNARVKKLKKGVRKSTMSAGSELFALTMASAAISADQKRKREYLERKGEIKDGGV